MNIKAKKTEITMKAIILGVLLSAILAAANAYLGLFAGMTVSASIPAAVISMGVLRLFKNSNILDLYSGIGSFGLECISRGAKKVTFVELNKNVAQILKKNLLTLSINDKAKIINGKVIDFLNEKQPEKFDIFFLDPPFSDDIFIEELNLIKTKKIYKNNHIIIIHREKRSSDNFTKLLKPIINKEYGRSKIIFSKFLD